MKRDLFLTDKTLSSNDNNIIIEEKHFNGHNLCTAIRINSSSTMIMDEYNNFDDEEKSYYNGMILDNESILKIAELIKQKQESK